MLLNSFKILKDRQRKFGWQNRSKAQTDKISIIVPVYNSSKYLRSCIESIRNQTYRNIEIILIDDKSTDNSLAICEEIAKKDKRIKVLANEKNAGCSASRNHALPHATGDYLLFVDSDDTIEKTMVETLKRACEVNKAEIAVCDITYLYDGDVYKKSKYANGDTEIISGKDFDLIYFLNPDMVVENVAVWNKLFRMDLVKDVNFIPGIAHADEAYTFKIVNKAEKIAYVHESLYNYRQNPQSIMGRDFSIKSFDIFRAFLERMSFYVDNGEYEMLWFAMKRHMHWLYLYKEKAKVAGITDKKVFSKNITPIKEYYKRNKMFLPLTSKDKKQITLFTTSFKMYCFIKHLQS